jgi:nucleoid DNA-binding protein
MKKSELIREAARRSGLGRRDAARGVDAVLQAFSRELGADGEVNIRGLGRLMLKPKRSGFLPALAGMPPVPIPAGRSVRLKATRRAVASLNTEPLRRDRLETTIGGNMDKKSDRDSIEAAEGSALGLDVGTSRLVLASGSAEHMRARAELNAFITVPYSKFTENILKQNKVSYQLNGGTALQVYGNEAGRFANVFNTEVRRPMMHGTLNPNEEHGLSVMHAIIQQLVRRTKNNETLRFSVPGAVRSGVSSAADLVYHEAMLRDMLNSMGYDSKGVNEGLAVVFAELEKENFSGIGISCGGGMCNVALAFMSIPVITFSIGKAGDYIDQSVGAVTGEVASRIRVIKEESLDLSKPPQNKYESALHVYYDDVILSLVESLRSSLAETKNMPRIDKPIPIVLSGGTAKPKGFLDKFRQTFQTDRFPLEISEIRMAADPLTATARGCLIAAMYDA